MSTTADELTAAADLKDAWCDRIEALAEAATPGEWVQGPLSRVDKSVATLWTLHAPEPDLGGRLAPFGYINRHKDAAYIAAMHPGEAKRLVAEGRALAALLRDEAAKAERGYAYPRPLAAARAINGGAQ
jgi:hypothetical protein